MTQEWLTAKLVQEHRAELARVYPSKRRSLRNPRLRRLSV